MATSSAESGAQALEMLRVACARKEPFDLAILDLHMPGMDGLELARAIKADPALRDVHLMLQSSVLHDCSPEQLDQVGIQYHLIKPVRQSQLLDCIANAMGASSLRSKAGSPEKPAGASLADRGVLSRRRILVVEDNAVNQEVTMGILEDMGCRVELAKDGAEAVAAVAEKVYDLVLMDCQMPVMDGFEATAVIRSKETRDRSKTRLAIIALTANAVEGDRERCLAAGMDDYLAKPFTHDQLREMLGKWLLPQRATETHAQPGLGAAEKQTSPAAEGGEARVPSCPLAAKGESPITRSYLANIAALQRPGRPSLLVKVISTYFQSSSELLKELQQAIEQADAEGIRKAGHSLKSSSANLGARQLAALSKELEEAGRTHSLEKTRLLLNQIKSEHGRVVAALQAELTGVAYGQSESSL